LSFVLQYVRDEVSSLVTHKRGTLCMVVNTCVRSIDAIVRCATRACVVVIT
jgi:hypothetical protein